MKKSQPTMGAVHVDTLGDDVATRYDQEKKRRKKMPETLDLEKWEDELIEKSADEIQALEEAGMVWKAGSGNRNTQERKSMASGGKAMPDGSFPIGNADELKKATRALGRAKKNSIAAVRAHIKRRAQALGLTASLPDSYATAKAEESVKIEVDRIWKDEDQQLVYGVVLEPDLEDSQGDIVSEDQIQKAAHAFLVESRKTDIQHDGQDVAVDVVESYCAPDSTVIAGEQVRKGAWVLVVKVNDPMVWLQVRQRKLTGFSIEGQALRVPVAA